jgi:hypothetical protein
MCEKQETVEDIRRMADEAGLEFRVRPIGYWLVGKGGMWGAFSIDGCLRLTDIRLAARADSWSARLGYRPALYTQIGRNRQWADSDGRAARSERARRQVRACVAVRRPAGNGARASRPQIALLLSPGHPSRASDLLTEILLFRKCGRDAHAPLQRVPAHGCLPCPYCV